MTAANGYKCFPSEEVFCLSYCISTWKNARLGKDILAIIGQVIVLIHMRGIIINHSQGTGPGRDWQWCNREVHWWDPIIPTPGNPLSIDSFHQMSLFQCLLHLPSVRLTYHPRPHYTSVTHCNSEMRYWSEAFTIPDPTTILSCLNTGYSTAQCISSVWTFTYTSILLDFPSPFTLVHFCIKVHVS